MFDLLQQQEASLQDRYPEPLKHFPIEGGHMAYRRFGFTAGSEKTPYFVKAHDPELLTESWRQDEMKHFLSKEARIYEHLGQHGYLHVPKHVSFEENMLVLSALTAENGWHWRVPGKSLQERYILDAIHAFEALERIPGVKVMDGDEITLDVFYDNGWDILHDTDLEQVIATNQNRWLKELHQSTHDSIDVVTQNIGNLAIKRNELSPSVLNHHDARQANMAWHPDEGVALVDWSWADIGMPGGDATMFLLDLHKSGINVEPYIQYVNRDYARLLIGYWLQRSQTPHMEGNDAVRMHQFASAITAADLLIQNG